MSGSDKIAAPTIADVLKDESIIRDVLAVSTKIEGRLKRSLERDDLDILFSEAKTQKPAEVNHLQQGGTRSALVGESPEALVGESPEALVVDSAELDGARLVADAAELAAARFETEGSEMNGARLVARAADLAVSRLVALGAEVDPTTFAGDVVNLASAQLVADAATAARLVVDTSE